MLFRSPLVRGGVIRVEFDGAFERIFRAGKIPVEIFTDKSERSVRFREGYFDLDQSRYSDLARTGLLRDVEFHDTARSDARLWRAKPCEALSEAEGNLRYQAG